MRSDVIVISSIGLQNPAQMRLAQDNQNPAQMRLAQDNDVVHTLTLDRPD
jgi:hypothetical protein